MSSSTDPARRAATRLRTETDPHSHETATDTITLDQAPHRLVGLQVATEIDHHREQIATTPTPPVLPRNCTT
jgi:hypothetical protein